MAIDASVLATPDLPGIMPVGGEPRISFVTCGPFGGGNVSLKAWPRVRKQLEEGSRSRAGVYRMPPLSYFAELVGSLV